MITPWLPALEAPPEVLLYVVAGTFLALVMVVVGVSVFHPDSARWANARKVLRTLLDPGPGGGRSPSGPVTSGMTCSQERPSVQVCAGPVQTLRHRA